MNNHHASKDLPMSKPGAGETVLPDEQGSITVLVVAFLPVLLLMLGLSIDVGRVLATKGELYKASDIAARELARRIDVVEACANGSRVRDVANGDAAALVSENLDGANGARIVAVEVENTETHVTVTCRAELPLLFSGLVNRRSSTIEVTGLARLKPYVADE